MAPAVLVFLLSTSLTFAAIFGVRRMLARREERRLDRHLQQVAVNGPMLEWSDESETSVVRRFATGPLPKIDALASKTSTGTNLVRLIEQSGVKTTPSAIIVAALACAFVCWLIAVIARQPVIAPLAAIAGGFLPFG